MKGTILLSLVCIKCNISLLHARSENTPADPEPAPEQQEEPPQMEEAAAGAASGRRNPPGGKSSLILG